MNCPNCDAGKDQVRTKDVREFVHEELSFPFVQRRRLCLACDHKFVTIEIQKELYEALCEEHGAVR